VARRGRTREERGPSLFASSSPDAPSAPEAPAAAGGDPRPLAIWAGVDEAGYGPLLGPLTIGCVALRRADPAADPWRLLAPLVGRATERAPDRLPVGDSKAVHARTPRGRARLERTALAFHAVRHGLPADARAFLAATAPPLAGPELAREAWWARLPERLGAHPPGGLERASAELAESLRRADLALALCAVRVVPVRALNASFARTGSKGATHWEECAPFFAHVWTEHGTAGVELVVDRHGGRMRYGDLLARAFPAARVRVVCEQPAFSRYDVHDAHGRRLRATFAEKADATSFPVALASCLAKYARELCMAAFNAHYGALGSGLAPTAGYAADARRWLADAGRALPAGALDAAQLVRRR
jgi:hypothetical protein